MNSGQMEHIAPTEPTRIVAAYICCKSRKRRCDGGTPRCTICIACGAECNYETVRKTWGPGKKKKEAKILEEYSKTTKQSLPPTSLLKNDNFNLEAKNDSMPTITCTKTPKDSRLHEGLVVNTSSLLQSATSVNSSQAQITAKLRILIFPNFLLPGTFDEHLRKFRSIVAESATARKFTPLMPPEIARRLIQNSFTEVMAEQELMNLSTFVKLLDAQYAATTLDSVDNLARWAIVSAVIALAIRSKTAPASEDALSDITYGFYQNATRVLPELTLEDPYLRSVQALLTMPMFARCISDIRTFIMLATNASRQLELLTLNLLSTEQAIDIEEAQQCETVYRTANTFDMNVLDILNTETTSRQAQTHLTRQVTAVLNLRAANRYRGSSSANQRKSCHETWNIVERLFI